MKSAKWHSAGLFVFVLLLNVPARLIYMRHGLWLDEAWVANSVLQPTLRGMFHYDRWVQTTPPLTLLLMRWAVMLFTPGEIAFRAVALAAGVAAMCVFALTARKMLRWPISLLAITFFATNYWAIRYSQEAKQYGCDQLAACVCLYVVVSLSLRKEQWSIWWVALVTATAIPLSLPAVFFVPSLALATGLRHTVSRKFDWFGGMLVAFTGTAVFAACWITFWKINTTTSFVAGVSRYSGASGGLSELLGKLSLNMNELMFPTNFGFSRMVSTPVLFLAAAGALACIGGSLKKHRRSLAALVGAVLPPVVALIPGVTGQYPLAPHPRLILWMLPSLTLLASFSISMIYSSTLSCFSPNRVRTIAGYALPALCILVSAASFVVLRTHPRALEENGEAFRFLAAECAPGDRIFLHGGLYEQFRVYAELIPWRPPSLYVANLGWPCCPVGREKRVSNPRALTVREDVSSGLQDLKSGRLWLVTPSGSQDHWSGYIEDELAQLPKLISTHGCVQRQARAFGETEVSLFQCESTTTQLTRRQDTPAIQP